MDEKDIEMIQVLGECHSITEAASRLYTSQSALSKRIKAVEEELHVEMLIRSRHGIHLTPEGEQILLHSTAIQKEMDQLRRSLDSMQDRICGTLRVGLSINFTLYKAPDILAAYHRSYPDVQLDVMTGQSRRLYRSLMEGSIDLAVLRGDFEWYGEQYMLAQENICLVCNPEYADTPLSDYLYIRHWTDASQEILMARWLQEHGLKVDHKGFYVDNIMTCMEMVKRGLGWSLLPEIALDDFHGVKKPCVFADGETFSRRSWILCRPDAAKLPQVRRFIDALKAAYPKA